MNYCKLCGKPLTLTPEYDYCMECQGRIMREATMPQNSFATKVITHEEARNTMMKIESNDAYYGELQEELKLMATYISQQQEAKEQRAKKVEEELKYTKEQFDKYWKEVCILKPRLAKVEELLGLYRSVHGVVQSWDTMPNVQKQIDVLEKELEEFK